MGSKADNEDLGKETLRSSKTNINYIRCLQDLVDLILQ